MAVGAQVSDIKKCTDSAMPTHNLLCAWNPNAQVPFELDHAFAYVLGGLAVLAVYVGGWSLGAGPQAVWAAVFARPARIAAGAPYVDLAQADAQY